MEGRGNWGRGGGRAGVQLRDFDRAVKQSTFPILRSMHLLPYVLKGPIMGVAKKRYRKDIMTLGKMRIQMKRRSQG